MAPAGQQKCSRTAHGEGHHRDGLASAAVGERMWSCKIMFSHESHVNTSTSGSPVCAGNDSKKRIADPHEGQASEILPPTDIASSSRDKMASRQFADPQLLRSAKNIVSHSYRRKEILLSRRYVPSGSCSMHVRSRRKSPVAPGRCCSSSRRQGCGELGAPCLKSIVRPIQPEHTNLSPPFFAVTACRRPNQPAFSPS